MSDARIILARLATVVVLTVSTSVLIVMTVRGDDQQTPAGDVPSAPASSDDAADVEERAGKPIDIEILQSVLGDTNSRSIGIRYFATQLRFTNRSNHKLSLPVSRIRLRMNGDEFLPTTRPAALQSYSLQAGAETLRFRELIQHGRLDLPAGATETSWIIFPDLPRSTDVPTLRLNFSVGGRQLALDVNGIHRDRLGLTAERIGPRGALGLLQVGGALDTINLGALVEELHRLSNQGISRVVVDMTEPPDRLPKLIRQWLNEAVDREPTSRLLNSLPPVPSTIREFHIAVPAGRETFSRHVHGGRPHVHDTTAAAVEWALEPVLSYLPEEEIVRLIERGHPLVRPAALATGASQLSVDRLPVVLRLAEEDDPLIQRGALLALKEFGEPAAIEALVAHARGPSTSTATLAVECLASSRYPQAHAALERLLTGSLNVPSADLAHILARYPREEWIDSLARLASGDGQDDQARRSEPIDVRRDALIALGRIGHPELTSLLSGALDSDEEPLRRTAFGLLVDRHDETSERLAVEYALGVTRSEFPSQQILSLFERVRDPQAVPLLVEHLSDASHDRRQLIHTLARIGHDSIDQTLRTHYDDLPSREQREVLSSLTELGSPHAYALAVEGIHGETSRLFHASVNAFQQLGNAEAVAVLTDTLMTTSHPTRVSLLARALAEIGTRDAVNGMRRAMYAGDERKKRKIAQKLAYLRERSPGLRPLETAVDHVRHEQWNGAEEAYGLAIRLDPELSEAYSGRGHCRLHLEQLEAAADDYRQALQRNPFDHMAVTGLALVHTRSGEVRRGIQMVEEAADRFPKEAYFAYNSACVYGRAIEVTLQRPLSEVRPTRVIALQEKAMAQLRRAVELGLDEEELEFMKRDPDLASLRELEEFQQLSTSSSTQSDR